MGKRCYAEKVLLEIQEYVGDNEWSDVIDNGHLHEEATNIADPGYRSDIAIYMDGSILEWVECQQKWICRDGVAQ